MYTEEKQPRIKAYRERKNIMKREVIENLLKGLGATGGTVSDDKNKEVNTAIRNLLGKE